MNPKLTGVLLTMTLAALTACGGDDKDKKPAAPAAGGNAARPAAGSGGAYDAAKATGSVKFTVKWGGGPVENVKIVPTGDNVCIGAAPSGIDDPRFAVNADGTLPNAFVWAKEGPHKGMSGLPDSPKVTLDQKGCMYAPHVFGLRVGAAFTVKNSDGTTHNVHARPNVNKNAVNQQQSGGATNDFTFDAQEKALPFACDIHSWMKAWAFVVDHPFFGTTGADGTVTIEKLPAGKYKFIVWHESMTAGDKGHQTEIDVEVAEGASKAAEATLK